MRSVFGFAPRPRTETSTESASALANRRLDSTTPGTEREVQFEKPTRAYPPDSRRARPQPLFVGAGAAPMRRHHRPHQSATVAGKGERWYSHLYWRAITSVSASGRAFRGAGCRPRFSRRRIRIERWDRICGWARASSRMSAPERRELEEGPLQNHRRGAQSTGWPPPRLPVLLAKHFYRDTI